MMGAVMIVVACLLVTAFLTVQARRAGLSWWDVWEDVLGPATIFILIVGLIVFVACGSLP